MKKIGILIICLLLLPVQFAVANDLSPAQMKECIRATIKVGALDSNGNPTGTGSGTMIDPRGYVLTNFHVIGDVYTGTLEHPEGKVLLAMVDSARQSARYNWEGKVVRADPRLDLALIRITNKRSGETPSELAFPYIPIGDVLQLDAGSRVWVLGYPSGVRSVNVTSGSVTGFEMNLRDQVAWLRTDAVINPGNSGGVLVNDQAKLVGIPTQVKPPDGASVYETIGFARSVSRIPEEWLQALAAGEISSYKSNGTFQIHPGQNKSDPMIGDGYVLSDVEHWYYLAPKERPGIITTSHPVSIAILDVTLGVSVVRDSTGTIEIAEGDPENIMISVLFPMENVPERGMDFSLSYEVQEKAKFPVPEFVEGKEVYQMPADLGFATPEVNKAVTQTKTMENTYVFFYRDVVTGAGPLQSENYSQQAVQTIYDTWSEQGHLKDKKAVLVLLSFDEQQFRVILSDYWTDTHGINTTQLLSIIQSEFVPQIDHGLDKALASFLLGLDEFATQKENATRGEQSTENTPVPSASTFSLEGRIIDATSGRAISGYLIVGEPNSNLPQDIEDFINGRLSDEAFFSRCQIVAIGSNGYFSLEELTSGQSYPFALASEGYDNVILETPADYKESTYFVGTIEMMK